MQLRIRIKIDSGIGFRLIGNRIGVPASRFALRCWCCFIHGADIIRFVVLALGKEGSGFSIAEC